LRCEDEQHVVRTISVESTLALNCFCCCATATQVHRPPPDLPQPEAIHESLSVLPTCKQINKCSHFHVPHNSITPVILDIPPVPVSCSQTKYVTDHPLSAKLVPTFPDRGYCIISTKDPYRRESNPRSLTTEAVALTHAKQNNTIYQILHFSSPHRLKTIKLQFNALLLILPTILFFCNSKILPLLAIYFIRQAFPFSLSEVNLHQVSP
jgi:hypothetical protein